MRGPEQPRDIEGKELGYLNIIEKGFPSDSHIVYELSDDGKSVASIEKPKNPEKNIIRKPFPYTDSPFFRSLLEAHRSTERSSEEIELAEARRIHNDRIRRIAADENDALRMSKKPKES